MKYQLHMKRYRWKEDRLMKEVQLRDQLHQDKKLKIPLKSEEVQVTKENVVTGEVVVKKKAVTENQQVTEEVTSERVDVEK